MGASSCRARPNVKARAHGALLQGFWTESGGDGSKPCPPSQWQIPLPAITRYHAGMTAGVGMPALGSSVCP